MLFKTMSGSDPIIFMRHLCGLHNVEERITFKCKGG